jgi:hypothetical protein
MNILVLHPLAAPTPRLHHQNATLVAATAWESTRYGLASQRAGQSTKSITILPFNHVSSMACHKPCCCSLASILSKMYDSIPWST